MKKLFLILALTCAVMSGEITPVSVQLTKEQRARLDEIVDGYKKYRSFQRVLEYGQPFAIDYTEFNRRIVEVQEAKKLFRKGDLNISHDPDFVIFRADFFNKDEPYVWAYDTASMVLKKAVGEDGKDTYQKEISGWEMHFQDRWIESFFIPHHPECISDFDVTVDQDARYPFRYKILFRHLGDNVYTMLKVKYRS